MSIPRILQRFVLLIAVFAVFAVLPAPAALAEEDGYDQATVLDEAAAFFGKGAQGLAQVIEKIFSEQGRPNAIIAGEEAGGALVVGLRYGSGVLKFKKGGSRKVHWNSPSIGIDAGGNAAKVFTLVYNLPSSRALFQRFPAVDGSLYYVAGVGFNYHRSDGITLAPIRLGVGLRAGVNVGYIHYRSKKSWNPL